MIAIIALTLIALTMGGLTLAVHREGTRINKWVMDWNCKPTMELRTLVIPFGLAIMPAIIALWAACTALLMTGALIVG